MYKLKDIQRMIRRVDENIMLEGKLDDLKGKVDNISIKHDPYGHIQISNKLLGDPKKDKDDLIDHIHAHIPDGNVSHTEWAVKRYHAGDYKQEDLPQLHSTISLFNKNKHLLPKRNINQYKNLGELNQAVSGFRENSSSISLPEQKKIIRSGSDLIHDKGGVKVYKLHGAEDEHESGMKSKGREACKLLGSSTWCISQKKDDENLFGHSGYGYDKPTYVIHLDGEKAPHRKIGYIHGTEEFQDENNHTVDENELKGLVNRNPELSKVKEFQGKKWGLTDDKDKLEHWNRHTDPDDIKDTITHNLHDGTIDHPKVLHELIIHHKDLSRDDRSDLISNPHTSSRTLEDLYHNHKGKDENSNDYESFLYLSRIAKHKNTPDHILSKLVNDNNRNPNLIHSRISENENASGDTLHKMKDSDDSYVVDQLIDHHNTDNKTLLHLRNRANDFDQFTIRHLNNRLKERGI